MQFMSTDTSLKEQHLAVRNHVGWYDFTHRVLEISGRDVLAFLEKMYIANISRLKIGSARYTTAVDEEGLILDDVVIFRMTENTYWISTLYMRDMLNRFEEYREDYEVQYRDITFEWRMYSVQGPDSTALVNAVVDSPVDDMRFFTIRDNTMDGIPVKVARSGYTGEKLGYEIYIAIDKMAQLEEKLAKKGDDMGAMHVTEMDTMMMTLACEAGFVLITDIYKTTPFEIGVGKTIDWEKDFVGKEALKPLRDQPPARLLVGFTVENDNALIYGGPHGADVMKDDEVIGRATKYTYGFTVGTNIGYALIDTAKAAIGDKVTINGYEAVLTEKRFI